MPTALITGASSGLGEQFAYALGREHYDLVLAARREDRLAAVAGRARTAGAGTVRTIRADLAQPETPAALYQQLTTDGIKVDYLVNNAGFGTSGSDGRAAERHDNQRRLDRGLSGHALHGDLRRDQGLRAELQRGGGGGTPRYGRNRDGALSGAGADRIPEGREQ